LAAGRLKRADDVFFLNRGEQAELATGGLSASTAAERIAVRREEWEATRLRLPPKFLRRGYVPDDGESPAPAEGRLTGQPASPGQARGRARVIYDISELSRVAPGEILVTRQTDPSWTPVFSRLGGLVLETGGVLAHGASLCREFGLPCVTALDRATERVRDGQSVALDGGAGTVDLL
jgi:pyruvate,water dikinase